MTVWARRKKRILTHLLSTMKATFREARTRVVTVAGTTDTLVSRMGLAFTGVIIKLIPFITILGRLVEETRLGVPWEHFVRR